MNEATSTEAQPKPRVWLRRGLRMLACLALGCVLLLLTAWAVTALAIDVRVSWLRTPLAVAYALAVVAVWIFVKRRRLAMVLTVGGFALVLAWWFTLKPSNDRDWRPDVAVLSTATINGDQVTIHNVRNLDYRTETDFTPRYYDKTYDLKDLDSLDLNCVYWGSEAIAHVFLSFGFAGKDYVSFSIETRPERGEGYSTLKGFFRQFELFYVVADERDVIGVRANYRHPEEQVYMFRTRMPLENQRKLFLSYIGTLNQLAQKPAWYNTLTDNCTTGVLLHTKSYPHRARYNWKILLSGYTDEYAYEIGAMATNLPFAELRERGHVNGRAHAAGESDDFSQKIREGIPMPKPATMEEFLNGQ